MNLLLSQMVFPFLIFWCKEPCCLFSIYWILLIGFALHGYMQGAVPDVHLSASTINVPPKSLWDIWRRMAEGTLHLPSICTLMQGLQVVSHNNTTAKENQHLPYKPSFSQFLYHHPLGHHKIICRSQVCLTPSYLWGVGFTKIGVWAFLSYKAMEGGTEQIVKCDCFNVW